MLHYEHSTLAFSVFSFSVVLKHRQNELEKVRI